MRKKLLFFIVSLVIYSCMNEPAVIQKCSIKVDNGISYVDGKKFSGKCNVLWQDSILWKTRTYKRGKKIAETSYYIPEGTLQYVGSEKDGKIDGDFTSYYRNGVVSIKGKLDNGLYIGEWLYYDDDGSLNKTLYYNKKGEKIDSIMHKQ